MHSSFRLHVARAVPTKFDTPLTLPISLIAKSIFYTPIISYRRTEAADDPSLPPLYLQCRELKREKIAPS